MATYNGEPVSTVIIEGVILENADGQRVEPEFPPNGAHRVRGLTLEDDETWLQIGADAGVATIAIERSPRTRIRRGLRGSIRALANAVRAGELADPQDMQRLVLALVREVLRGED